MDPGATEAPVLLGTPPLAALPGGRREHSPHIAGVLHILGQPNALKCLGDEFERARLVRIDALHFGE